MISNKNPAYRRYRRRCVGASLAYVGAVAVASALIRHASLPSAGSVALSLLAGGGIVLWIWAMARLLIELDDEYLRMLMLRRVLVATGFTLSATGIWGMAELLTTVPRLPVFFVFPVWGFGFLIGALVNKLTLGDSGRPR